MSINERLTMKTRFTQGAVLLSTAMLSLAGICRADGDEQNGANQKSNPQKTYKGNVTVVNQTEKMVTVKGLMFSKTFNVADNCKVAFEDKPEASLAELRPGQQVEIQFQNARGVLIADQITQKNLVFTGHITALDATQRTLIVKSRGSSKTFVLSGDCAVVLRKDKAASLENLKIGQTIQVVYESSNGSTLARRIEQKDESYVGTIQALDAGQRTVRAKGLLTEKKFNLANDCHIVVESKPDAAFRELRIGDRVEFSYEDDNGVLVANRIGRESSNPPVVESTPTARIDNQ
jgi:Cu/Ag efflux protein CusF